MSVVYRGWVQRGGLDCRWIGHNRPYNGSLFGRPLSKRRKIGPNGAPSASRVCRVETYQANYPYLTQPNLFNLTMATYSSSRRPISSCVVGLGLPRCQNLCGGLSTSWAGLLAPPVSENRASLVGGIRPRLLAGGDSNREPVLYR